MAEWQWFWLLVCCSTISMAAGCLVGRCWRYDRTLRKALGQGIVAVTAGGEIPAGSLVYQRPLGKGWSADEILANAIAEVSQVAQVATVAPKGADAERAGREAG